MGKETIITIVTRYLEKTIKNYNKYSQNVWVFCNVAKKTDSAKTSAFESIYVWSL